MTATAIQTKVNFDGKIMKEIKNMVKKVKKSDAAIFEYIKFDVFNVSEGYITVTVNYSQSDNKFTLSKTFNTAVEGNGSFLIPMDNIKKIKNVKSGDQFAFKIIDENNVEFIKDGAKIQIATPLAEDYPNDMYRESFKDIAEIDYSELDKLNKALKSTFTMETRPTLQHVLIRDGYICTTDSHRLYRADTNIKHDEDIIINKSGLPKLMDVFSKKDLINVAINDDYIKFYNDNSSVLIKLFNDANYPEVDRLIPDTSNTEFTIYDVNMFKQILKDAGTIAQENRNNVIKMDITKDSLAVSANSIDNGSYENAINILNQGDNLSISMSNKYLLDAIDQLDTDQLNFKFVGGMRPFIITPANRDDVLSLVLPVRTY